jgi:hypothetical protein
MPAEITLTVTKFTENTSTTPPRTAGENCVIQPDFHMNGDSTGAWKRDPDGQVFLCPAPDLGTIAMRRRDPNRDEPIVLSFRIASAAGVPALSPTQIVFEQKDFRDDRKRAKEDPDGTVNFVDRRAANDTLTITNRWVHHGKSKDRASHQAPSWKFWIHVKTADGRVGWIDPDLENSEDMS